MSPPTSSAPSEAIQYSRYILSLTEAGLTDTSILFLFDCGSVAGAKTEKAPSSLVSAYIHESQPLGPLFVTSF